MPIYHEDGTLLGKVVGTRFFPSEQGKKAGVKVDKHPNLWAYSIDNKAIFEISVYPGDRFKIEAELFSNTGYLVRCHDMPLIEQFRVSDGATIVSNILMSGNLLVGCKVGLWLKSDGTLIFGAN